MYRKKGRALFLSAIMVLSVVALSSAFAGSAAAAVDDRNTDRIINDGNTNVTNGTTVTVTVDAGFTASTQNASLSETVTGGGIAQSNISNIDITPDDGQALPSGGGDPGVQVVYDAALNPIVSALDSDSFTLEYDITIPEDTPVGTNITFNGSVSDNDAGDTTPIGGDTQITVVAGQQAQNVTADLPDNENLPSIIENGDSITQDVSVTNDGSGTATPNVSLTIEDTAGNQVDTVDEATPSIPPGGSQEVPLSGTVDVNSVGGFNLVLAVDGTEQRSRNLDVTAPGDTGAITGDVRQLDGTEIENVEQLNISVLQEGSEISNSPVQTDANGEYTVEVPVASDGSNYTVEIDSRRFVDFSRDVNVQPQATERVDIRLRSDLAAAKVGVGLFDREQQEIVGDSAALLADGEFDGQLELAVYAQAQNLTESAAPAAPSDTTATLTVSDLDGQAGIFGSGEGAFPDPDTDEETVPNRSIELNNGTVSVDAVDTDVDASATVSNSNGFDPDGNVALGTFNVTAGDATEQEVENFANAVAQGNITADVAASDTPSGSASISDTADLTYFVEGEKSTQHQVLDTDGNPIEGATVFISYQGAPQNLEDVEDFQNDAGESFLVAQSNEDGIAVIPGLVPDTTYNVYVQENGFNIFNSSTAPAAAGTLSAETNIDSGTFVADYTLNQIIDSTNDADGSGFSEVYAHTLRQRAQDIRLSVTVANADGTQVKSTEIPDGNTREVQVTVTGGPTGADQSEFSPLGGQPVDLELVDTDGVTVGQLNAPDNQVTTNSNGVASTTFTAPVNVAEDTNVSASTSNANNELFETNSTLGQNLNDDSDQAEIEVFTTGTLTGDIRDQNEVLIQDDDLLVSLEEFNTTSGEFEEIRPPTSAPDGQYNFEDLETGEQYRVNAEFQNETGFATVDNLRPGTNTRDVVVQEIEVNTGSPLDDPAAEFDADADGDIDINELGQAGQAFAQGDLTITELGQVGQEFAS
jgi:surface glycoprotein (TIGR04207 family)